MTVGITTPVKLNNESYGFTVVLDGLVLIPGFRTYMGQIQAPMRKIKTSWYPLLYLDETTASSLYDAVSEYLDDTILSAKFKATDKLVFNSAIAERFGVL